MSSSGIVYRERLSIQSFLLCIFYCVRLIVNIRRGVFYIFFFSSFFYILKPIFVIILINIICARQCIYHILHCHSDRRNVSYIYISLFYYIQFYKIILYKKTIQNLIIYFYFLFSEYLLVFYLQERRVT